MIVKAKDIILEKDIQEDECDVCKLHEEAYKSDKLPSEYLCPHCGKPLDYVRGFDDYDEDWTVIGEVNFYTEEQKIIKAPVTMCNSCNNYAAIAALPVIYNGNHDIYYTGGENYFPDHEEPDIDMSDIRDSIKQYIDRTSKGEKIPFDTMMLWVTRGVRKVLTKFLYDNGLKR